MERLETLSLRASRLRKRLRSRSSTSHRFSPFFFFFFSPFSRVSVLLACSLVFCGPVAIAESGLGAESSSPQVLSEKRYSLDRRVSLKIIDDLSSPLYEMEQLRVVKRSAGTYLREIEAELARVFHYTPENGVSLSLLSRAQYQDYIGAASWANAVFFGGMITVPVLGVDARSLAVMRRSLRHEYVHAVCAELSDSKTPAWFEEGLAQLIEGPRNPRLVPAFQIQLQTGSLLPFSQLASGFTALPKESVAAAYAQSLFAVRTIVNRFGFTGIRKYFAQLSSGSNPSTAFKNAFGIPQSEFETAVGEQAILWLSSGNAVL